MYGHRGMAALLISKGAAVNPNTPRAYVPLHFAASRGHHSVAKLLIASGANVNAVQEWGLTPLHEATLEGHGSVVELLLSCGSDPNQPDQNGESPLHKAAFRGHADVVEVLVGSGTKVEARCKLGRTPMHLAALRCHTPVLRQLASMGADVNAVDNHGCTPMHPAAVAGNEDAVTELVSFGADLNAADERGRTPLHLAAQCARLSTAKKLVELGADVQAKDGSATTLSPVHYAAVWGASKVATFLVSQGASQDIFVAALRQDIARVVEELNRDATLYQAVADNGRTPLHLAALVGDLGIVKLLVGKGADVSLRDGMGCTPWDLASLCEHHAVADHLRAAAASQPTRAPGNEACGQEKWSPWLFRERFHSWLANDTTWML